MARLIVLIVTLLLLTSCGGGDDGGGGTTGYTINAIADPDIGGTAFAFVIDSDTTYSLNARPEPGYSFVNWTENGVEISTEPNHDIIVNSDRTFVAHFNAVPIFNIDVPGATIEPNAVVNVELGTKVTIDASLSHDPDGDLLTYSWTTEFPPGTTSALSSLDADKVEFIADLPTLYYVRLTITDGFHQDYRDLYITAKGNFNTIVGGIINADTTWDLDGSPYAVDGLIQVAEGVTLTVEPGVKVFCLSEFNTCNIQLFGGLSAIGTDESPVEFFLRINIAAVGNGVDPIVISHTKSLGTSFQVPSISDSLIIGGGVVPTFCNLGCNYERNIFVSGQIVLGQPVNVVNNVFYGGIAPFHTLDGANENSVIKSNSFIFPTGIVEMVRVGGQDVDLTLNYWSTTESVDIAAMIRDRNDDLNITGFGIYEPFLLEVDANNPEVPDFK